MGGQEFAAVEPDPGTDRGWRVESDFVDSVVSGAPVRLTNFEDGAPNDIVSEAKDVAAFLMWTAEPKLAARKQAGFTAVFLLTILAVLLYLTNKRIWAPIKHGHRKTPAE